MPQNIPTNTCVIIGKQRAECVCYFNFRLYVNYLKPVTSLLSHKEEDKRCAWTFSLGDKALVKTALMGEYRLSLGEPHEHLCRWPTQNFKVIDHLVSL